MLPTCEIENMLALGAREGRKPRRVVAKFECHPRELSPRVGFIVTIRTLHNERVLAFYNDPGTANVRGSMSPHGTQLKFTGHHGYGSLPPQCRRSALNVGLSAEDRPDSEPLRMRAFDPKPPFT